MPVQLTDGAEQTCPGGSPPIFLVSPPGVGKSTLGALACAELDRTFLDLDDPVDAHELDDAARAADVIALPWSIRADRRTLTHARRLGTLLLLWAHPLDMQARSGHAEPLFTPVPRLVTRGGFGRNGTGCREFRALDRASDATLLLVGLELDECIEALVETIEHLRERSTRPIAVRAKIASWPETWRHDARADPGAANVLADAMARYVLELEAGGMSPRRLREIRSDLHAAGLLVFLYDEPSAANVLGCFRDSPCEFEFQRIISDRPPLLARYRKSVRGFESFLQRAGLSR